MRFIPAFLLFIGISSTLSSLISGPVEDVWLGLGVSAAAGLFLWWALRTKDGRRAAGEMATILLTDDAPEGHRRDGTFARVHCFGRRSNAPRAWAVTLNRRPKREDIDMYGIGQRGWVWLDGDGLPRRVRFNRGLTWESCLVLSAAPLQEQGYPE